MTIDRFIGLLLGILELGRWDGSRIDIHPPISAEQQVLRTVLNGVIREWLYVLNEQDRHLTDHCRYIDYLLFRQFYYYHVQLLRERSPQAWSRTLLKDVRKTGKEAFRMIRTTYHLERI